MRAGENTSRLASAQARRIVALKGTGWTLGVSAMAAPNWVKISSSAVAFINSAVDIA